MLSELAVKSAEVATKAKWLFAIIVFVLLNFLKVCPKYISRLTKEFQME